MVQIGFQNVALKNQVGKFALPDDRNEPCPFQFLEMVRECGRANWLAFAQIRAGDAVGPSANLFQHVVPAWIGQGLCDPAYLAF